ncbi:MAG: aspartate aminotransferase family protein [SAR324 cluster bacterium]|nr:aspartate aminotransferase family protein [SAR324 cluster bacterium]MBL7036065.1 aspartate aminotransferase family protein [SAR324 cluster bacterium]
MANRDRLLNFGGAVSEKFSEATGTKAESNKKTARKDAELELYNNNNTAELLDTASRVFLPTYAPNLILTHSLGARVWDSNGKEYLDLGAGISVNSLGHNNAELVQALTAQAGKIWHTTNLYLTEPAIRLAEELVSASFADRIFFCNSGAEANEAAIKIARKFSSLNHPEEKREILTFEGSFHGRTLATVTATAQPKYQAGFEPLPGGFRYCPFNDFEAAEKMIGPKTCAVMIEPIQGEGGVNPVKNGFLSHLRELCDQHGVLLIFDEIQSGMGRTGKLFGYQWEETDVQNQPEDTIKQLIPDIVTMAKALGGGLPIGAMLCTEKVAQTFKPGDHGTTFGGNPVVTAVAGAAFRMINTPEMMAQVQQKGEIIRKHLEILNEELSLFETIRGRGLMLGAVLSKAWQGKGAAMVSACQQQGVLLLVAGPNVLRFLPPLNISTKELQTALELVSKALKILHTETLANTAHR